MSYDSFVATLQTTAIWCLLSRDMGNLILAYANISLQDDNKKNLFLLYLKTIKGIFYPVNIFYNCDFG